MLTNFRLLVLQKQKLHEVQFHSARISVAREAQPIILILYTLC